MTDTSDLSKRMDDLPRRFDDLRVGIDQLFTGLEQRLTTLTRILSGWFTFLTLILVSFAFSGDQRSRRASDISLVRRSVPCPA